MEKGTVTIVLIISFFVCVTIGAIAQQTTEFYKNQSIENAAIVRAKADESIALYQSIAGVTADSAKRQEAFVDLMGEKGVK